jgi:hypothetical protein
LFMFLVLDDCLIFYLYWVLTFMQRLGYIYYKDDYLIWSCIYTYLSSKIHSI